MFAKLFMCLMFMHNKNLFAYLLSIDMVDMNVLFCNFVFLINKQLRELSWCGQKGGIMSNHSSYNNKISRGNNFKINLKN